MVLRSRDSRRRRTMLDESVQSGVKNATEDGGEAVEKRSVARKASAKKTKQKSAKRVYAYGADRRNQNKTTDLIPKRMTAYCTVAIVLLACVGMLNVLAYFSHGWRSVLGNDLVNSLQLTGRGTLATWFGSFLFITASAVSLQIYALRKYRCDDYRGSYRVWGWLAAVFLLGSVNCGIDLAGIFRSVFEHYAVALPTFGSVSAWLIVQSLALSGMLTLGVMEVRTSRGTLGWLSAVGVAFAVSILLQVPEAQQTVVEFGGEPVFGNGWLIGTTGLLLATLTYARYVYLLAHGMISLPVSKPKALKKTTQKASTKKKVAARKSTAKKSDSGAKTTTKKRTKPKPADSKLAEPAEAERVTEKRQAPLQSRLKKKAKEPIKESAAESDAEPTIKISKADRRRQRKLEKQQQRRAA